VATPARDREAFDQAIVRGSDLLKQNKLSDATRAFRAALEIEPDNQKVLALLGLTHFRAGELDAARPIYEDLVELAPTDASHRLNLGLVYLKLNDAERAIASLEASRSLDPSQGRAVSYLGLAYARAGRYAEAYRSFLLAGQNDLATEIEINLTQGERDGILAQLGRPPGPPIKAETPNLARTKSKPRTAPPSPPPKTEPPSSDASSAGIAIAMSASGSISIERVDQIEQDIATRVDVPLPPVEPEPGPPPDPMTTSQRFVLPNRGAGAPEAGAPAAPMASRVSAAVEAAVPSTTVAAKTASGAFAAKPLSELATDELVRPDDGVDTFEIATNGALLIRVAEKIITRLDGVHVTGGELSYEVATRRSRGHQTEEKFQQPMHAVSGKGYMIAIPPKDQRFSAVLLDDDILYVREDLVFAFESSLRWENGNVPGLRGRFHVIQFRGDGALAVRLGRPLTRVKLPASAMMFVDADRLAGWIGRVIPRAVVSPEGGPLGTMCVECTGEGIVLVEPAREDSAPVIRAQPPAPEAAAPPEPPPLPEPEPVASEIAPEVADFAADLTAFNAAADAAEAAQGKPPDDETF
jgi:hypothetical protein